MDAIGNGLDGQRGQDKAPDTGDDVDAGMSKHLFNLMCEVEDRARDHRN